MKTLAFWVINVLAVLSIPLAAVAVLTLRFIARNHGIPRSSVMAWPDAAHPSEPAWPQPVAAYVAVCTAAIVLAVLAVAMCSALHICRVRAERAAARGRCLACSYDLTGNVSGVCPECGTAINPGRRKAPHPA